MAVWWMLSWEMLARYRRLLGLTAGYFALVCLVYPVLPALFHSPDLAALLAGWPLMILTMLVAMASHGNHGELEARASAFPARLFLLPVPSWKLAGPPLVLGTLMATLGWAMIALGVLRPCGVPASFWPGALAAALLAWCQALSWLPFPLPWLRLIAVTLVVAGIGLLAIALGGWHGDALLVPLYLAITATAYAVALGGIRMARHGVGLSEPSREAPARSATGREGVSPFTSPLRAQFWLEIRQRRWFLIWTATATLVFTLPAVHFNSMLYNNRPLVEELGMTATVDAVGAGWLSVTALAVMPALMSLVGGADIGRFHRRRDRPAGFFLTLPMPAAAFVRAKLMATALAVVLMWLGAAGTAAVWAALTGHLGGMAARLVEASGSVPAGLAALLGGFLLVCAVCWLLLASGMWAGLLGSRQADVIPAIEGVLIAILTVCTAHIWMMYPDRRWAVTAGLAAALLVKAAVTVWVVRGLLRERVVRTSTAAVSLTAWLALSALVGWLVCRIAGGGPVLFAGVLVLMPLASPLAAPLALHWARHR